MRFGLFHFSYYMYLVLFEVLYVLFNLHPRLLESNKPFWSGGIFSLSRPWVYCSTASFHLPSWSFLGHQKITGVMPIILPGKIPYISTNHITVMLLYMDVKVGGLHCFVTKMSLGIHPVRQTNVLTAAEDALITNPTQRLSSYCQSHEDASKTSYLSNTTSQHS